MRYINENMSLNEIIETYPETLYYFISSGFKGFEKETLRKQMGKIPLKMALKAKKISIDAFVGNVENLIEQKRESSDVTLNEAEEKKDGLQITGLLPCPVRLPLLESFQKFEKEKGLTLNYELKAASSGLDWLKEDVIKADNVDKLADIFISAGFDLFFEEELMGKFKNRKVFKDFTKHSHYNADFENEEISLKDPEGDYSMLAVVPAVFLVNVNELGDREAPKTWEDLLKPEFERSVSLPIADFDLFNAILINLYKKYGEDSIRKLGRCLNTSMHPSQMVKSNKLKSNIPTITIMPYFFTKMVKEGGPMKAQWPEDGAIISPIFMLTKREKENEVKEIADFFAGKEVAEVLAHQGLFPSVHPKIDNRLDKRNKFMWVGWDYIYNNNIGGLINKCNQLFEEGVNS